MRYQQEAIPSEKFRPEGDGYDHKTAIDSGGSPDELTKHWASLDPRTGMVLKGRSHPTWDLMVAEETELGNTVVQSDDGRYYSVKLPRYIAEATPVLPETGLEDTTLNVSERANRDYDFAVENRLTLGGVSALKREWGTARGLGKKVPFFGGLVGLDENLNLIEAANRIQNPNMYNFMRDAETFQERLPFEEAARDPDEFIADLKRRDQELLAAHIKYISAEKTFVNKLVTGVSALPTWAVEFYVTGGLAFLGDDAATKAGEKLLGAYAKSTVGKIAIRAAGLTAGGITRSAGLGHQVLDKMSRRQVDVILGLREEEGWAMSALIAWGDTVIEAISESAGEDITKVGGALLGKLPFGSKMTDALSKAWIAATGGTKGEFARKLVSKGGYSNILGEISEERLGTILRAVTNVDDFGLGKDASMIDRLKEGLLQDIENIGVELGVLSVVPAGQFALARIADLGRVKPEFTGEFDQTAAKQAEEAPVEAPVVPTAKVTADGIEAPTEAVEAKAEAKGEIARKKAVLKQIRETKRTEVGRIEQEIVDAGLSGDLAEQEKLRSEKDIIFKSIADKNVAETIGKDLSVIRLESNDGSKEAIISPSSREKGKWQVSLIDRIDNKALGHNTFETQEKAIRAVSGDPSIEGRGIGQGGEFSVKESIVQPTEAKEVEEVETEKVEPGTTPEKPTDPPAPVTIETANTSKELDTVAQQIVTQGVDPAKTSARQADIQEDRASLGLDGIASAERKSWQKSLQQAKDLNLINTALRTAAEVNAKPRPLNDVETAGLVMKTAQLKKEHKSLMERFAPAEDQTEIDSLARQLDDVEKEFDSLSQAIHASGTEKGRALAAQKLTINQDFDLLSLKSRAKKIKGKPLTAKETAKITQLAKDLELQQTQNELLQIRINELMARRFIKEGSVARYSRMTLPERTSELDTLVARTRQLLDQGCN